MAGKKQEAKKGKPSSAGRRKDSIAKYWLRSPRNKERKVRRVIRRALELGGVESARNVALKGLNDGGKFLKSVVASVSKEQQERWEAARERRLAARKVRGAPKREARAARRAAKAALLAEVHAAMAAQKATKAKAKATKKAAKAKPKPKKGS